jgi:hypothetical protein
MFNQSLRLLGTHLKNKIQGRGMAAVRNLFDIAERSRAPRLTLYNHVEEQNRLDLLAAIEESLRTSSEGANLLVSEEVEYTELVVEAEQARIAAEIEHKKLAEQEALKLFVDRAVHIAVIETNKIHENPAAEEDATMHDLVTDDHGSDKGKSVVKEITPPSSPKDTEMGSSSSPIPPAVQAALEDIKSELKSEIRNEFDELRADLRIDMRADLRAEMNASGAATNQRIDELMAFMKELARQMQKP